ncbi:hypothetical protein SALBM135S_01798 [Streptomyces alboniger]
MTGPSHGCTRRRPACPRTSATTPAIADHILRAMLPDGLDAADGAEDVVLLAARFE